MRRGLFSKILSRCRIVGQISSDVLHFWLLQLKFNASVATWSDPVKMQFSIAREAHTLEKGKSLRNPRKGYGKLKAERLEADIARYHSRFGNSPDVAEAESILDAWRTDQSRLVVQMKAGEVESLSRGNFDDLTFSRHSVRVFSNREIDPEKVNKALEIAARTPSACNRQAWRTHIYSGAEALDILKWQGGAKGFEEEIPMIIVVTCELRAFLSYETHQAWVDGGLYAMNLLHSLQFEGFGTIPLSCGFNHRKLKELYRHGIERSQIPVMIIGFGNMEDCMVAVSSRKSTERTNVWHR